MGTGGAGGDTEFMAPKGASYKLTAKTPKVSCRVHRPCMDVSLSADIPGWPTGVPKQFLIQHQTAEKYNSVTVLVVCCPSRKFILPTLHKWFIKKSLGPNSTLPGFSCIDLCTFSRMLSEVTRRRVQDRQRFCLGLYSRLPASYSEYKVFWAI